MCGCRTRWSASSSWRNTRWRRSLLRWTLTAASAPERRARYTVLNPPSPTTAEVNPPVIASTCAQDSPRGPGPASTPFSALPADTPKSPSSSRSRPPAAALAPHPQQKNLYLCTPILSKESFLNKPGRRGEMTAEEDL
jgi:hypothetical protein